MTIDHTSRDETLIELLPQLVWTCTAEGNCDYLSSQWIAYTGVSQLALLNLQWLERIHPEDRDAIKRIWTSAVQTGRQCTAEMRVLRHDGKYRWFETVVTPLVDEGRPTMRWFGSSTGIHEARETRIKLERENRRLVNLVGLAPAVFCSFALRPDGSMNFQYAGPRMEDLFGVDPEELKNDAGSLFKLFHPDDLGPVIASIDASAKALSPWQGKFRVNHPAKGERWIEGQSTAATDENGSIIWHGFVTDITERKHAEADQDFLLQLGSALQSATSPEMIGELSTHMLCEHVNVERCSLTAISLPNNEATGLYQRRRGHSPVVGVTYPLSMFGDKHWLGVLASGTTTAVSNTRTDPITAAFWEASFRALHIGAVIAVPLRREGQWIAVLSLAVTEPRQWSQREIDLARIAAERVWLAYEAARALAGERQLHETLAESEERLRLALQSAAIGTWDFNPLTQQRQWDARSREIFGFPPDFQITGESVLPFIHPEDRDLVRKATAALIDPDGSGRFEMEYRINTWTDGSLRYLYAQGQTYFQGSGAARHPFRSVGTLQDITARKRGEEDLRRANQELEQFAYAAAHDLQEPLRNVGLATQILSRRYKGRFDEEADRLLKAAVEGPARMQEMVKDLLCYARALDSEEGEVAFADSDAVLTEALKNLHVAITEKSATIVSGSLLPVRMSKVHLRQIFQNLIGNSLKYSGSRQPVIHVSRVQRAGTCAFLVKDNGLGIAPEFRERAFGVFKRLHSKDVPGTGIGLALCKRIVNHYGGDIWIESEGNEGVTLLFTPPLA